MKRIWRKLHSFLWLFRFDVWAFDGRERSTGAALAFAYAGDEPHANHLARAALADGYRARRLGRFWAWEAERKILAAGPGCAFVAYEWTEAKRRTAGRFIGETSFRVPLWLRVEIDLEEVAGGNAGPRVKTKQRNMRRCIRNFGLEPELSTHLEDLREFYERMHLPYIRKRHGEASVIRDYAELEKRFRSHGELVFACRSGVRLGGVIIDDKDGVAKGLLLGILDGNEEYLRMGVSDAVFCFQMERMRRRGFRRAGLGHSRAFLGDGALQYKRKLGGRLCGELDSGYFSFRFLRRTPAVEAFLRANPFVTTEEGGPLRGAVFAAGRSSAFTGEDWKAIESSAFCEGLDGIDLYADDSARLPLKLEPGYRLPVARTRRLESVLPPLETAGSSASRMTEPVPA